MPVEISENPHSDHSSTLNRPGTLQNDTKRCVAPAGSGPGPTASTWWERIMGGLKTKFGVIAVTVVGGIGVAMPAVAGERGEAISSQTPAHTAMNDVVHEVLTEAGLSPGKLDMERQDRMAKGLERLVEAGIIEEASVGEMRDLARTGELGSIMSERAKAAAAARKADAGRPENPGNSGGSNAGGQGGGNDNSPESPGASGSGQGVERRGGGTDG